MLTVSRRLLIIPAILVLSCVELPPSPVLPSYDIQASVPLIDRAFTVADFSSKDTALVEGPDGGLIYRSVESFEPFGIASIEVTPEPVSKTAHLGLFHVPPPAIDPIIFSYEDVTGSQPPPGPFVMPPGSFSLPQSDIGPLPSFEYIEFDSGTIAVTVRNTLPFPVELQEPLVIRNNLFGGITDTSAVVTLTFPGPIAADVGVQTQTASLRNVVVRPRLQLRGIGASTSGSAGSVSVGPGDGLRIEVAFSGTRVRAAKAAIPAQSIVGLQDSSFVVDDSVTLAFALFRTGSLNVEVENGVDVDVNVSLRFNELQDRVTGQPFEVIRQFQGRGTQAVTVSLPGLRYHSAFTGIGTLATFRVGVSTIANDDSTSEVKSTDSVRVNITPGEPISAERITGRIKPTLLDIESGAQGFSLGEIASKAEGDFVFDSLVVTLDVMTSSGFAADYDLQFIGMDRRTSPPVVDSLTVPPPAGSGQHRVFPVPGEVTSILLDNTAGLNTFLARFFPHLPDTFIIRGTLLLNPPEVFGTPQGFQTAYDTSKLYSSVDMHFPVRMGITNGKVRDTISLSLRERFPKEAASATRSGNLFFEIENGLPLDLSFRSALLRTSPGGMTDTLLMIPSDGPRSIASGTIGSDGAVLSPTVSRFTITMTGPEAEMLEQAGLLWIELQVESAGGGGVVKVRTTDTVRVRASGNLIYQVNKP